MGFLVTCPIIVCHKKSTMYIFTWIWCHFIVVLCGRNFTNHSFTIEWKIKKVFIWHRSKRWLYVKWPFWNLHSIIIFPCKKLRKFIFFWPLTFDCNPLLNSKLRLLIIFLVWMLFNYSVECITGQLSLSTCWRFE